MNEASRHQLIPQFLPPVLENRLGQVADLDQNFSGRADGFDLGGGSAHENRRPGRILIGPG